MTMSEFGSSFGRLESREKEKRYKFGCVNPTCDWYNVIQEVRMTSDEYNQIRSGKAKKPGCVSCTESMPLYKGG